MQKCRKQRSANFSNEEKIMLLNIITKYKNVIENKKTDTATVKQKWETWNKVEAEFNSLSPGSCYREAANLKKFYENKKKEVRKAAAEEKMQVKRTGGGPLEVVKKDPAHDLVLDLINNKTVHGLTNRFDSDSNSKKTETSQQSSHEFEYELNVGLDDFEILECTEEPVNGLVFKYRNGECNKAQMIRANDDQLSNILAQDTDVTLIDDDLTPSLSFQQSQDNFLSNIEEVSPSSERPHQLPNLNKNSIASTSVKKSSDKSTWKRYTPSNLRDLPSTELNTPQPTPKSREKPVQKNRKRPATVIRSLKSSNIAEKYNQLIEKRLQIANMMIVEFHQKTNGHLKRVEILDLEIAIKKRQLKQ